jgi:hypothetical protein
MCLSSDDFYRLPPGGGVATDTCKAKDSAGETKNNFIALEEGRGKRFELEIYERFWELPMLGREEDVRLQVGGTMLKTEDVTGDDSPCSPAMGGMNVDICAQRFMGNSTICE